MRTEKSDVYSISGLFIEGHTPHQAKFFGGFFSVRTDSNEPRESFLDMPFTGHLVDCYGKSKIYGEIGSQRFRFDKQYESSESLIEYHFKKNAQGIWVGEYFGEGRIGKGYATVKTNLDWKGVDMIVPRPFDPEGWAKDLLEQMVDNGMLEIVKDDKTGEELVIPK